MDDGKFDDGEPFNVTETTIACPFDDGVMLPIQIAWVNRLWPMLHIKAPEVMGHLRAEHNAT